MNNMKHEKSCGAIIISDNKILIVKQNIGFYGFPKGHVEENETEEETAIREVKEEVGIDITIDSRYRYEIEYMVNENTAKTVVFFIAYPKNNNIICDNNEIAEAIWLDIDDAINILSYDDLKNILKKVKKEKHL